MARARNIKPGLYKNEDLAECSVWARYIWPGLWMLADREGRLEDRPKRIKGELLPFDSQDVEPLLRELEAGGFILRYKNSDGSFIQISKFCKHQTPHYSEKKSVIKPPPLQEIPPHIDPPDSKNPPPIKRGPQPPDSLNPDSLNPDSLNPEKSGSQGSRLAPEWVLPTDWKAWAMQEEGWREAQVLAVAEDFRDYWTAKAGKDARKVDWFATWRKWVRKQKDFAPKKGNGHDHQSEPASVPCVVCTKPISGKWISYQGGRAHDACWEAR